MGNRSTIFWNSINDKLPELEKLVIVACEGGGVRSGMMADILVPERDPTDGIFRHLGKHETQWGYEENDFEYWEELNVTHWAEFPKLNNFSHGK